MSIHIFFFLLAFNLVTKADDRLIQVECHNANAPKPCIQCLKSDSRSLNADKFAIAKIILNCTDNHAGNLHGKFSALAQKHNTVKAYEGCVESFIQVKQQLESAAKAINKTDYNGADIYVFNARNYNLRCYSTIQYEKLNPKGLGELNSEMKKIEEIFEAAMRIIERFGG